MVACRLARRMNNNVNSACWSFRTGISTSFVQPEQLTYISSQQFHLIRVAAKASIWRHNSPKWNGMGFYINVAANNEHNFNRKYRYDTITYRHNQIVILVRQSDNKSVKMQVNNWYNGNSKSIIDIVGVLSCFYLLN